jgi:hypothetical protein
LSLSVPPWTLMWQKVSVRKSGSVSGSAPELEIAAQPVVALSALERSPGRSRYRSDGLRHHRKRCRRHDRSRSRPIGRRRSEQSRGSRSC